MPNCRICQHSFATLKFNTEHIGICTRCVNTLNDSPEPAANAEQRFAEKLARGMLRNAERDLQSPEEWKRQKAQKVRNNLDGEVAAALHNWITRLLEAPGNSTRDFKIMRAHRRGLLRLEGFAKYPSNWTDIARKIRHRDGYQCKVCGCTDSTLDVHHIIYLSHHGTNQQSNLITLCRRCHEVEHDREFDWPEAQDPEADAPIQPSTTFTTFQQNENAPLSTAQPQTPLPQTHSDTHVDLHCPQCETELVIPSEHAQTGQKLRCKQCSLIFLFGINDKAPRQIKAAAPLKETPSDSPQQKKPAHQTPIIKDITHRPQVGESPGLPHPQRPADMDAAAPRHFAFVVVVIAAIILMAVVFIASR